MADITATTACHSVRTLRIPTAAPTRSDDRRRAVGRIGGFAGLSDPDRLRRLGGALGAGAQLLDEDPRALIVDCDACWIDGRRLVDVESWRAIVGDGRLGDVSGAFAVAWREADGTLCLARDAIGERSLFYASLAGGVIFASTLHAIVATGLVPVTIDPASVARYLSYAYLPGADSMISGIRKLMPGEIVRVRDGVLSCARHWTLPPEPDAGAVADEGRLRGDLRRELEGAVRRRLPAGETVGAFLSGGLDSSLIVALARRFHDADLLTYSVSFGDGYANELPFSSMVAEHCGTRHHIVELSPAAILQHLDESIASLSDPIGDPLTVPNTLLFREAARDVGVVLNGEGGDPCFGGPKNVPMLLAELLGDGAEAGASAPFGRERSYLRAHQKCYDDLPDMLVPGVHEAIGPGLLESEVAPLFQDDRWRSFVAKLMAMNTTLKGPFHILHKVDAASAPFGAVARSPLFDRAIVELACAIPPGLKLRGSTEKYLLKEAVRDLLPAAIIDRPKSGMLVPVEAWFKGPLLSHAKERLLDGLAPYGLFQRPYLERLIGGRLPGLRPRRGVKIWMLVTLESWLRSAGAFATL